MDIPSSQINNDSTVADKKRQTDGYNVISDQFKAAQEAKEARIRSFRYEDVVIDTCSGIPFKTKMWVSEEEPFGVIAKVTEIFKCETCSKEFDKKQKLLLHARYHK